MKAKIKNLFFELSPLLIKVSLCSLIILLCVFSLAKLFTPERISSNAGYISIDLGNVPCENLPLILAPTVLFVFFSAIPCLFFFEKKANFKTKTRNSLFLMFSTFCLVFVFVMIYFILFGIINVIFRYPILNFSALLPFDIIKRALGLIPGVILAVSIEFFFFRITKNKKIRLILMTVFALCLLYLSGCFFTINCFCPLLQGVYEIQPFGICVSYFTRVLTSYRSYIILPEALLWALIFFIFGHFIGKREGKEKNHAKKPYVFIAAVFIIFAVPGISLINSETAPLKIEYVTESEEIAEYYSDFAKKQDFLSTAKIDLCYGFCDSVHYYDENNHLTIYQREKAFLINSTDNAIIDRTYSDTNYVAVLYYFLLIASAGTAFFLCKSAEKYGK